MMELVPASAEDSQRDYDMDAGLYDVERHDRGVHLPGRADGQLHHSRVEDAAAPGHFFEHDNGDPDWNVDHHEWRRTGRAAADS